MIPGTVGDNPGWKLVYYLRVQHGVWDPASYSLLRKAYFGKHPKIGHILNYERFRNTYFTDHYSKFRDAIGSVQPAAIMFCQPPAMELWPEIKGTEDDDENMVHAVHYYDGMTFLTKHWYNTTAELYSLLRNKLYNVDVIGVLRENNLRPAFVVKVGERAIRNSFPDQLRCLQEESRNFMRELPLIFSCRLKLRC